MGNNNYFTLLGRSCNRYSHRRKESVSFFCNSKEERKNIKYIGVKSKYLIYYNSLSINCNIFLVHFVGNIISKISEVC